MGDLKLIKHKRSAFERVKGAMDWVAIFCTVLSVVLTVVIAFSFNKVNDAEGLLETFRFVFITLSILFLGIILLAAYFSYENGKLMDERRQFESLQLTLESERKSNAQALSMVHTVAHISRDILCTMNIINSDLSEQKCKNKIDNIQLIETEKNIVGEFNQYCSDVMSNVKNLFDVLTGDESCVSIKLFNNDLDNSLENTYVTTFMRDSICSRPRGIIDKSMPMYSVLHNSAFREILTGSNRSYYYCNDLINNKDYDNSNSNWRKEYNACLVSALSVVDIEERDYNIFIGALCVDNFKGGFDDQITHNALATIFDIFSYVIFNYYNI